MAPPEKPAAAPPPPQETTVEAQPPPVGRNTDELEARATADAMRREAGREGSTASTIAAARINALVDLGITNKKGILQQAEFDKNQVSREQFEYYGAIMNIPAGAKLGTKEFHDAVATFQRDQLGYRGRKADGIIGTNTIKAIDALKGTNFYNQSLPDRVLAGADYDVMYNPSSGMQANEAWEPAAGTERMVGLDGLKASPPPISRAGSGEQSVGIGPLVTKGRADVPRFASDVPVRKPEKVTAVAAHPGFTATESTVFYKREGVTAGTYIRPDVQVNVTSDIIKGGAGVTPDKADFASAYGNQMTVVDVARVGVKEYLVVVPTSTAAEVLALKPEAGARMDVTRLVAPQDVGMEITYNKNGEPQIKRTS